MRNRPTQRSAIFIFIGLVALVYLINLVVFTLTAGAQLAAGGLLLIALGGLWIFFLGRPEILTCDRDTCRIIKPRFLWQAKRVKEIRRADIEEVRVEETYLMSHDGPGQTGYTVILLGRNKASQSFSTEDSQQSAQAIANRIRDYLKTVSRQPLVIRRVPWVMIAVGTGGIGIGVVLILMAIAGRPNTL